MLFFGLSFIGMFSQALLILASDNLLRGRYERLKRRENLIRVLNRVCDDYAAITVQSILNDIVCGLNLVFVM
jgi:hypothetical protein